MGSLGRVAVVAGGVVLGTVEGVGVVLHRYLLVVTQTVLHLLHLLEPNLFPDLRIVFLRLTQVARSVGERQHQQVRVGNPEAVSKTLFFAITHF